MKKSGKNKNWIKILNKEVIITLLLLTNFITLLILLNNSNSKLSESEFQNCLISIVDYPANYFKDGLLRFYPNQEGKVECKNKEFSNYQTSINKDGFRGKLFSEEKINIGIFGDSFVYGNCLRDNETIDAAIQNKINELSPDKFNVMNFGVPGYNFNSTTKILEENTEKHKIDYAIINLIADDDLIKYDVSGRYFLRLNNKTKAKALEMRIYDYFLEEKKDKILIAERFEDILVKNIIRKGIDKKTKIIINLVNSESELLENILKKYNLTYVVISSKTEDFVEGDGHPAATYNLKLAKIITEKIISIEDLQNHRSLNIPERYTDETEK